MACPTAAPVSHHPTLTASTTAHTITRFIGCSLSLCLVHDACYFVSLTRNCTGRVAKCKSKKYASQSQWATVLSIVIKAATGINFAFLFLCLVQPYILGTERMYANRDRVRRSTSNG